MHHYATQFDSPHSTLAYRAFNGACDAVAKHTLEEHAERVALWHRALTHHYHTIHGTFTGFGTMEYSGDPTGLQAWHARQALLGAAGRTSKLALDAALTGYYGESAALTRRITESWAHAAYLRVRPAEGLRWYQSSSGAPNTTRPPKYQTLASKLRKAGIDRSAIDLADSLFEQANNGAHPSPEFLGQVRGVQEGDHQRYEYVPAYKARFCGPVLEWGIRAMYLTLWELAYLELQPQEWHDEWKNLEKGLQSAPRRGYGAMPSDDATSSACGTATRRNG